MNFRWVRGYVGHYKVSDIGQVISLKRGRKRVLKQAANKEGYLHVNLSKDGKSKTFSVHKLVLEAFVCYKPKGMEARHFPDQNPANNKLSNLSWISHKQNMADKELNGTTTKGISRNAGVNNWNHKINRLLRILSKLEV